MRKIVFQVDLQGQDKPSYVEVKEFLENLPKYIQAEKELS
jgi:hypothetical protein